MFQRTYPVLSARCFSQARHVISRSFSSLSSIRDELPNADKVTTPSLQDVTNEMLEVQLTSYRPPRAPCRQYPIAVDVKFCSLNKLADEQVARNPVFLKQQGALPDVVFGREFSGIVREVADGETRFKPGDEVYGVISQFTQYEPRGSLGPHLVTDPRNIALVPPGLSLDHACFLPWATLELLTGMHLVDVQPTDVLLLHMDPRDQPKIRIGKLLGKKLSVEVWASHPGLKEEVDQILDMTDQNELKKLEDVSCDAILDWETPDTHEEKRLFGLLADQKEDYPQSRFGSFVTSQELYQNMASGPFWGMMKSLRTLLSYKTRALVGHSFQYQWCHVLTTPLMNMGNVNVALTGKDGAIIPELLDLRPPPKITFTDSIEWLRPVHEAYPTKKDILWDKKLSEDSIGKDYLEKLDIKDIRRIVEF